VRPGPVNAAVAARAGRSELIAVGKAAKTRQKNDRGAMQMLETVTAPSARAVAPSGEA
jgi:hypothetical protein